MNTILLRLPAALFAAVCLLPAHGEEGGPAGAASLRAANGAAPFPGAYHAEAASELKAKEAGAPAAAPAKEEAAAKPPAAPEKPFKPGSLLRENDVLAFYGHPNSKNMGILGRYTKDELNEKLDTLAADYKTENGGRNIIKAFYIIYGTCWPEGEIGRLNAQKLTEYIEYAKERGMLVFIDHQIGKYDPVDSLKTMLPFLKHSNVHLALDPEWRTTKPMREFGYVTADEINRAQKVMEDYMTANNIEGERMLVIHQFREVMIRDRPKVRADFERVRLVHCMDGVGTPKEKYDTYEFNARATNMPVKAFKLFYDFKLPGVLVDSPLLSAKQVYALNPRPYLIMYQ